MSEYPQRQPDKIIPAPRKQQPECRRWGRPTGVGHTPGPGPAPGTPRGSAAGAPVAYGPAVGRGKDMARPRDSARVQYKVGGRVGRYPLPSPTLGVPHWARPPGSQMKPDAVGCGSAPPSGKPSSGNLRPWFFSVAKMAPPPPGAQTG